MKFSYNNLRNAERVGERVGNWKGMPVFASTSINLHQYGSGAYYIVYNDDNLIVRRDNGAAWWCYGQVSEDGQVTECDRRRYSVYGEPAPAYEAARQVYCHDTQTYEPAAHAVCGKDDAHCDGTAAEPEAVVADVKIGLDVDATLKAAREMTVDSLLEGFSYGLDAKG